MNYDNRNIMLSEKSARNFYHDMTHIDQDNQARISAFMEEIDANIVLYGDENKIAALVRGINMNKVKQLREKNISFRAEFIGD